MALSTAETCHKNQRRPTDVGKIAASPACLVHTAGCQWPSAVAPRGPGRAVFLLPWWHVDPPLATVCIFEGAVAWASTQGLSKFLGVVVEWTVAAAPGPPAVINLRSGILPLYYTQLADAPTDALVLNAAPAGARAAGRAPRGGPGAYCAGFSPAGI